MGASEQIRNFITTAETYRTTESSQSLTQLQRHVKILFVVSERGAFAAADQLTCEFYLSLHRLLVGCSADTPLTWLLVRLLEHLCTDADALTLLRDRYCFLPLLVGLLTARPEGDRTLLLLGVTESLTTDLALERYEPFVRPLLRTLSDMVCEKGEHSASALRTLCQLVRAGPVLPESLLATAHRKRLARALGSTDSGLLQQLYAAELLLAVQPRRQPLPPQQLHSFTDLVFSALTGGLAEADVRLMAQAGRLLTRLLPQLTADGYGRLATATRALLHQVTPERYHHAGFVFRPLEALVRRGAGDAEIWLPLVKLAAHLMDRPETVQSAAGLLEAALERHLINADGEEMAAALASLQTLLDGGSGVAPARDYGGQALAIVILLSAVAGGARCRTALAESWRPHLLRQLLQPLPSAPGGGGSGGGNNYDTTAQMVVGAVELARTLGSESAAWLEAQLELVREPPVLAWLAHALNAGDRGLVRRALTILCEGGLPGESVDQLSDSLSARHRALPAPSGGATVAPPCRSAELSYSTAERVDAVLSRLQQDEPELKDASMVDMMELYEFKVATMTQTVTELELALQSASDLNTSVRLQLAQASAEGTAVRRLLLAAERRVETLHASSRVGETRAAAADVLVARLRDERAACQRETQAQHAAAQRLERELATRTEGLRAAQQAVADTEAQRARLAEKTTALTATVEELRASVQQQAITIQEQETRLQESGRAAQRAEQAAGALRTQLANLELLCRSQEQSLAEKERDNGELVDENRALRKIQDMIHSISSKSKDKSVTKA